MPMRPAEVVLAVIALLLVLRRVFADRFEGRRLGSSQGANTSARPSAPGAPPAAASSLLRRAAPTEAIQSPSPETDGDGGAADPTEQPAAKPNPRQLAKKYERLGHVVVVRTKLAPADAAAFAATFAPPVHVVLYDGRGITGELRLPELETLHEDRDAAMAAAGAAVRPAAKRIANYSALHAANSSPARHHANVMTLRSQVDPRAALEGVGCPHPCLTSVTEGGTRYLLRADRVMFCSGNTSERTHFRNAVKCVAGETVVDMFAGVGYFTVPLACSATPPARIVAIEKNPISAQLLALNVAANDVRAERTNVTVVCGDNRAVGDEVLGRADRVLMGYIPDCAGFLPRAMQFLKIAHGGDGMGRRGTVHYHFLAPSKAEAYSVVHAHLVRELGEDVVATGITVDAVRVVKSFAPKRWHCVADLKVAPRFQS
uniref:SAM-dependent methyltransferase TRM5/TYW2-type domain-containing protein n=1 Tax=Neobodo designis TaxID=312471 RepID=A0A7S1KWV8_NEODS|mmetsp:Transcript_10169/g.31361  ORF Transcript_10169/g.31361 Transcript_10169/m.31361 type:complete len:430 (+) Transcript_10169:50-1339(+)